MLRRSTPRLDNLPITISRSAFKCVESSAVKTSLSFSETISVFASFKSKRVTSSLRAWLIALSISWLSTSETMSNDGITIPLLDTRYLILDARCRIGRKRSLLIDLHNLDVAFRRADLHCGFAATVNQSVDFHASG